MRKVWDMSNVLEKLRPLLACRHLNTPLVEGKTHCPDCGSGVVFHWQVLRCEQCNQRRNARYFFRRLIPQHAYCVHCGTAEYTVEWLTKPAYYQLDKAFLVSSTESDYVNHLKVWCERVQSWTKRRAQTFTRVWLDPVTTPSSRTTGLLVAS